LAILAVEWRNQQTFQFGDRLSNRESRLAGKRLFAMTKRKQRPGGLFNPKAAMCACLLAWAVLQTPLAPQTSGAHPSAVNQLQKTESLQRSALAANPDSPELHGALGLTLLREGKYEEAVRELGLAAQQIPDSAEYNFGLAEALIGWGHFGVAEQFLNAVQSHFANYSQFHYDLGLAEYSMDRSREAEGEFREALKLDPKQDRAHLLLAACMARNGDLSGAADSLQLLAKGHPNEATYWLAWADVLVQMDASHYREALRASRHALALKPGDPGIQFKTAVILLKLQDYAAARPLLEHVVKVAPNDSQAHIALASTYSHLGDQASAHRESQIVARLAKQESGQASPTPAQP
jgi:predicted Zn-dependent protease